MSGPQDRMAARGPRGNSPAFCTRRWPRARSAGPALAERCTHIHALDDLRLPVVQFHCTHLDAPAAPTATVRMARGTSIGMREMTGFQFAGETAVHGVPTLR